MSRRTRADAPMPVKVRKLRCAIYTRKSTEEGVKRAE
jgi:site-specific DNA recombinase